MSRSVGIGDLDGAAGTGDVLLRCAVRHHDCPRGELQGIGPFDSVGLATDGGETESEVIDGGV